MKRVKILSVIIGVIILLVSFLGMVQYPASKSINNSIFLIKVTIGGPFRTIAVLNNYIMNVTGTDRSQKSGVPVSSKDTAQKTKKIFKILFFTLNSILLTNEKSLMIFAAIFIGSSLHFKSLSGVRYKSIVIFHKVKNYIKWSLKFITPIQKCVSALVDRYDINPIYTRMSIECISPRIFRMLKVRGFFYI